MKITTRPYKKDPTRQQVDIMLPRRKKPIRRRIVAPHGMGPAEAKAWGERRAKDLLRDLLRKTAADKDGAKKEDEIETLVTKTVAEFWPEFEELYISKLKLSARQSYEQIRALHLEPVVGQLRLTELNKAAFAKVKAACMKKGHSPAMINHVVAKLRRMMVVAAEQSLIEDDALPKIRKEDVPHREVEVYSRDQLTQMIAYAEAEEGTEDHILALLLVYGGLRIGEAAGLHWSDVDLTRGTMKICRNMMKGTMQDAPKGVVGTIALHPVLHAALRDYRKRRTGERILKVKDRAAGKRVRKWQQKIGAPVFGPHRIRHSVLTYMAMNGVDPYKLQAFARHADLDTTLRYYVHLNKAELTASAVATLDFAPTAPKRPAARKTSRPRRGAALAPPSGNWLATSGNAARN